MPSYKWQALFAVCFGTYMATMDFSIVNVALPRLADEFDRRPDTVVWATLSVSLVVTGLTLTAGRAGDLFGRRRIYLAGWVVFTTGMTLAAVSQSLEQLIAARVVQSVGMALATATGNAIVTDAFPDEERGRALGMVASVVGAGLMTGPILGGVILSVFDWPAIFYLRVPIGFIAMALAFFFIRESGGEAGAGRRLDIPGAVTLFVALAATLLALNRGQLWGWASPPILLLLALGVASLVAFVRIEARSVSPVLAPALFRIREFTVGVVTLITNFLGQSAVIFLMPFYLIEVRDYGPAQTGLVIAAVPVMMLLLASYSGYISDRFGFRHQPTVGLAMVALGLFSLSTLQPGEPMGLVMARLALIGIGSAIFGSPNASAILGSVPRTALGTASAAVATSRNIGNAMGLGISSTILVAVAASSTGVSGVDARDLPPSALLDGIRAAFFVAGCASSLAVVASLIGRRGMVRTRLERDEREPATGGGVASRGGPGSR